MIIIDFIKEQVKKFLQIEIFKVIPIYGGVMNFTFLVKTNFEDLIIKINPKGRDEIALKESKVISLCKTYEIKVPILLYQHTAVNSDDYSFILYKKLAGDMLSTSYDNLSTKSKQILIEEIVENFTRMSSISLNGSGDSNDLINFSSISWYDFLKEGVDKSLNYIESNGIYNHKQINRLDEFITESLLTANYESKNLVWSDFDPSNIIVDCDGRLSGFIDFEGTLGGHPNLALGYLYAKSGHTTFFNNLINKFNVSKNELELYAIIRYLRLISYSKFPLPTGIKRDNLNDFLPYSNQLINKILLNPKI